MEAKDTASGLHFITGQAHHVHKSYVWLRPLVTLGVILIALLFGFREGFAALLADGDRFAGAWQGSQFALIALGTVIVLLLMYVLVVFLHYVAYRFLTFTFDVRELTLRSGFLVKRQVHVPYARVQSVNHTASLVQRIVGVCTVAIETAGGSSNKAVTIPYVLLSDAEHIRRELFLRKAAETQGVSAEELARTLVHANGSSVAAAEGIPQAPAEAVPVHAEGVPEAPVSDSGEAPQATTIDMGEDWRGVFAGQAVGQEKASYELGLTGKELLMASVTHSGSAAAAAVLAVVGFFGIPFAGIAGIVFAVVLAVAGLVAGAARFAVSYGNFRALRRGSRVEVAHGLLKHEFSGIDISRVQSVVVRQSFFRRMIGYCQVSLGRIDSASEDGTGENREAVNTDGLVVHPFVKIERVDEILDGLVPEFNEAPNVDDLDRLPKVALRRAIIRRALVQNPALYLGAAGFITWAIFGFATASSLPVGMSPIELIDYLDTLELYDFVYIGIAAWCALLVAVFAVTAVVRTIDSVLWHRRSGFALSRAHAVVYNDGFSTERVVVPRQKIQHGTVLSNPLQRAAGVARLQLVTAAGVRQTKTTLWDVAREDGERWLKWIEPRPLAQDLSFYDDAMQR